MTYLEKFFDVCLLLDNYCDIEEDLDARKWDNLFLAGHSLKEIEKIAANKFILVPYILNECADRIKATSSFVDDNKVFEYYYTRAFNWIEESKNELPALPAWIHKKHEAINALIETGSIRDLSDDVQEILQNISKQLRPEFLQTDSLSKEVLS